MITALLLATAVQQPLVVGSKNFAENRLLGEMAAQLAESRLGVRVERRLGLAGTTVCFEALRTGGIDLYPEYSGTGLVSLLGEAPQPGRRTVWLRVRGEFRRRWGLAWIGPLGFENAYELAGPRAVAETRGLRTISDLARVAGGLHAGFGYEFLRRPDGLPGLETAYGLSFREVTGFQQALKYQAAAAGRIDCLDVYTTDGRLLGHDLVILEDDQDFFPPYEAALLVRTPALERFPGLAADLQELSGSLDAPAMRRFNRRLQEDHESEAVVAAEALAELGLTEGPLRESNGAALWPGPRSEPWG